MKFSATTLLSLSFVVIAVSAAPAPTLPDHHAAPAAENEKGPSTVNSHQSLDSGRRAGIYIPAGEQHAGPSGARLARQENSRDLHLSSLANAAAASTTSTHTSFSNW